MAITTATRAPGIHFSFLGANLVQTIRVTMVISPSTAAMWWLLPSTGKMPFWMAAGIERRFWIPFSRGLSSTMTWNWAPKMRDADSGQHSVNHRRGHRPEELAGLEQSGAELEDSRQHHDRAQSFQPVLLYHFINDDGQTGRRAAHLERTSRERAGQRCLR